MLLKMQEKLIEQVQREYSEWEKHVREWRQEVQSEIDLMKVKAPEGKVKVDLVKENVDFERATFLTDDIDVTFVCDEWVLWKEIMENANKVAKYDYIDTERKSIKEQIIIDNGYYGIAVEVLDMYDEDENQPDSQLVNPDTVIPDPKCTKGSRMRYIWFNRKLPIWKIKNNESFNTKWYTLEDASSWDMRMSEEARADSYVISSDEWMVEIYDHYTVFEGKKYLTTWINGRENLIRCIELAPLSKAEKLNPMKIKYPVIFHRRRSYPYRWAWYRIREEVGNTEDIVTQLRNLEIAQARIATYWPDTFIDQNLWADIWTLQKKKPGWLISPVTIPNGSSIANHIYQKQYAGNINLSQVVAQGLLDRVERNTGYTDISKWVSPNGSQTKWEIQTLQNNANKILSWVSDSYLDGEKEFYYSWYRSYQENMSPKSKKTIALFDNWWLSKSLKKSEFIADGKVIIDIRSASQEAIKNERSVTKLMALANSIIPNLRSEQSVNTFLRTLVDKSWVDWLEGCDLIPKSYDERLAESRLEMLNNNIEVMSWPEAGEDLKTHIDIYEENALDTPAARKLITKYKDAYMRQKWVTQQPMWQVDSQGTNIAQNLMAQQQNPATNPLPAM